MFQGHSTLTKATAVAGGALLVALAYLRYIQQKTDDEKIVHPTPDPSKRQWIFGFGSLISQESRSRSGNTGKAYPCVVRGVERCWSMHVNLPEAQRPNSRIPRVSALAARKSSSPDAETNGVVVEVPADEMSKFDEREIGYKRVAVFDVEIIHRQREEHCGENNNNNNNDSSSSTTTENMLGKGAQVWCYVDPCDGNEACCASAPPSSIPDSEYPLIQSYIDAILDGCVDTAGETFAIKFLETTKGLADESRWVFRKRSAKPGVPKTERKSDGSGRHVGPTDWGACTCGRTGPEGGNLI